MKKLTMVVVMLAVLVAVAVPTVSALCANGSMNGNSCDLVTVLRGAVRIANGERCKQVPRPADCLITEIAGMSK